MPTPADVTWAGVAMLLVVNATSLVRQWLDSRKLQDVHNQTQNDHDPEDSNLRDDVDRIELKVDALTTLLVNHIAKCA